ncbi:Hsp20/alpha crystallin family protein [Patescibacteria group bacterium]|nr:Hsp20/alpha crystallin family protein [Patescibacteria group bacterium]
MPKNSSSFFERLTGNLSIHDNVEEEMEKLISRHEDKPAAKKDKQADKQTNSWMDEGEGQLTVDMYHKPSEIIVQAMLAGVKPEDLDVSITQDMITIKGQRQKIKEVSEENYYYKELYWGGFSRSILLPQEIDVENSEATLKNGLLTIKLPKTNKEKSQKIKIKSE